MNHESLLKIISEKRNILNGIDITGKQSKDLQSLKFIRYYLVLYYATVSPIYSREEFMDNDGHGFSLYKLKKIAKALRLDFDVSRIAVPIFMDGRERKEINVFVGNDNHRYFVLTSEGLKVCKTVLKELEQLDGLKTLYVTNSKLSRFLRISS